MTSHESIQDFSPRKVVMLKELWDEIRLKARRVLNNKSQSIVCPVESKKDQIVRINSCSKK
jgi:hypothetical protein